MEANNDGNTYRRTASLKPSEMADDPQDLYDMLAQREAEDDFGHDWATGARLYPQRTTVDGMVEYLLTAIASVAKANGLTKAHFLRMATKLGIMELLQLRGWTELELAHRQATELAMESNDRSAIRVLEGGTSFSFPHRMNRKLNVSIYPWVNKKIAEAATVAGVSVHAMIIASLLLGLSTMYEWHGYFSDDLAELTRHMQRRKAMLEAGTQDR